jgi:hypothetical protein
VGIGEGVGEFVLWNTAIVSVVAVRVDVQGGGTLRWGVRVEYSGKVSVRPVVGLALRKEKPVKRPHPINPSKRIKRVVTTAPIHRRMAWDALGRG